MKTKINSRTAGLVMVSFALILLLENCKVHNDPQPLVTPIKTSITSFSPEHGVPGTLIALTGTRFSSTLSGNVVKIGNKQAIVADATATTMSIIVPAGAITGNISVTANDTTVVTTDKFEVLADVPRAGLVAFYPFFNDTKDKSGNNLDATLANYSTGNGPDAVTDRFGKTLQAYSFDGDADYIKIPNAAPLQISGSITIGLWLNLTAVANPYIISKQVTDCKGYQVSLGKDGDDATKSNIFISAASASEYFSNASFTGTGQWVFIGITKDAASSTTITYINGGAGVHNDNIPALVDCAADVILGATNDWTNLNTRTGTLNGLMDDVTIYNRALSADEIKQLFQQTVTKYNF